MLLGLDVLEKLGHKSESQEIVASARDSEMEFRASRIPT